MTRSRIGLPYLDSPIWKQGYSAAVSIKLFAAYVEHAAPLRTHLAAEGEVTVEFDAEVLKSVRVACLHSAHGIAHDAHHLEHAGNCPQG